MLIIGGGLLLIILLGGTLAILWQSIHAGPGRSTASQRQPTPTTTTSNSCTGGWKQLSMSTPHTTALTLQGVAALSSKDVWADSYHRTRDGRYLGYWPG
ncbi:hypothetical protein KDA_48810 [Dictyobacter alpinus]|uniref:Uncharacterized protein n=1 Tax=Dictyobacter alpinus TaxID=2014873 RepID=A0A402BDQ6_9CHLR|nr:hypothetical protein KDA_48810 [Dictyobacter alpinus]